MCTSSVSNVIYHKFSHGAAFYTLNGKSVDVLLEFAVSAIGVGQFAASSDVYLFFKHFEFIKRCFM